VQKRIGEVETDALALTKLITAYLKADPTIGARQVRDHVAAGTHPAEQTKAASVTDAVEREHPGAVGAV
jgi:hypothetical protein